MEFTSRYCTQRYSERSLPKCTGPGNVRVSQKTQSQVHHHTFQQVKLIHDFHNASSFEVHKISEHRASLLVSPAAEKDVINEAGNSSQKLGTTNIQRWLMNCRFPNRFLASAKLKKKIQRDPSWTRITVSCFAIKALELYSYSVKGYQEQQMQHKSRSAQNVCELSLMRHCSKKLLEVAIQISQFKRSTTQELENK